MSFANKQPPKKKRKSRTAFTNHQIFELEKRFLYQKYLSPADRDEIAAQLGLSNAQVRPGMVKCLVMRAGGCKTGVVEVAGVFIVFSQLCCQTEQYNSSYKPVPPLYTITIWMSRWTVVLIFCWHQQSDTDSANYLHWAQHSPDCRLTGWHLSHSLSLSRFRWYENSTSRPSDLQTLDN